MFKYVSLAVVTIAAAFIGKDCSRPNPEFFPEPTTIIHNPNKNAEHEHKEQIDRAIWVNQLHRTAPNHNWQQIEYNNQVQKAAQFAQQKDGLENYELFANGKVAANWQELGATNVAGRVVYADYDTQTLKAYAAADGGQIFEGSLTGNDWVVLNDHFKFNGIKLFRSFTQQNTTKFVVVSNKYVHTSTDGGITWLEASGLSNVTSWGGISKATVTNDSTLYILLQEWDYTNWYSIQSIYKSTDLGTSFTKVTSFRTSTYGSNRTNDIFSNQYDTNNTVFFLRNKQILTVGANSLDSIGQALPNAASDNAMLTASQGTQNQLVLYAYQDQNVYHSTDSGNTWSSAANIGSNPFMRNSFAASINTNTTTYFGSVDCYKSQNNLTYNPINSWVDYYNDNLNKLHADIPAIIPFIDENNQERTFICTDGGLYISNNDLLTVKNISMNNLNNAQYYDALTNTLADEVYAGSQDQGFQRSTNPQYSEYNQIISGDYGHLVSNNNGSSLWYLYPGFVAYNQDAMFGWADATLDFNGINHFWMPPMVEHPTNTNEAYLLGETSGGSPCIYHLVANVQNGTITATLVSNNIAQLTANHLTALNYSPFDPSVWYALTEAGEVLISVDDLQTFSATSLTNGPESHYFYGASIYVSQTVPGRILVAGSGYSNEGVWISENNGTTWKPITNGLPNTLTFTITASNNDSLFFAATEAGAYVFTTSDSTWHDLTLTSAPQQTYWNVHWIEQKQTARFSTYGRGIWDFKLVDTTAVSTPYITHVQPTITVYPNPCTNAISVQSNHELTELSIYNLEGKLYYQQNAMNNQPINIEFLPQGQYLLQVKTQHGTQVKKILKL